MALTLPHQPPPPRLPAPAPTAPHTTPPSTPSTTPSTPPPPRPSHHHPHGPLHGSQHPPPRHSTPPRPAPPPQPPAPAPTAPHTTPSTAPRAAPKADTTCHKIPAQKKFRGQIKKWNQGYSAAIAATSPWEDGPPLAGLGAHIPIKTAPAKDSKTLACYTLPPGLLENPIGVFHSYHVFFCPGASQYIYINIAQFPIYGPHTQVRDTLQDFTMIFRLASHTKLEI